MMIRILLNKITAICAFLAIVALQGKAFAQDAFYVDAEIGEDLISETIDDEEIIYGLTPEHPFKTLGFILYHTTSIGEGKEGAYTGEYSNLTEINIYIKGIAKVDNQTISGGSKMYTFYGEGADKTFLQPTDEYDNTVQGLVFNTTAVLHDLTLRNYNSTVNGPAIKINPTGAGTLNNVNVIDNYGSNNGGAIYSSGELYINNSFFARNQTKSNGSAVHVNEGTLEIINSLFTLNNLYQTSWTAGTINVAPPVDKTATFKMVNSTVFNNSSDGTGGAGINLSDKNGKLTSVEIINTVAFNNYNLKNSWYKSINWDTKGEDDTYDLLVLKNNIVETTSFGDSFKAEDQNVIGGDIESLKFGDNIEVAANGVQFIPVLAGSVLEDAANMMYAPEKDMIGNLQSGDSRDIGAIEYQVPASELYVDSQNGLDTNSGSMDMPLQSFNKALTLLNGSTGVTIFVKGTFNDQSLEIAEGSDITIKGWDGQAVFAGSGTGKFLSVLGSVTLDQITVKDYLSADGGGAINVLSTGSLVVKNCNFINNQAINGEESLNGGAIVSGGILEVYNSYFGENRAFNRGGAIAVSTGSFTMKNTTVHKNTTAKGGGAVAVFANSTRNTDLILENNTFTANYNYLGEETVGGATGLWLSHGTNGYLLNLINVSNNLLYNYVWQVSDGWQLDIFVSSGSNVINANTTTFRNNLFHTVNAVFQMPTAGNNTQASNADGVEVIDKIKVATTLSTNQLGVHFIEITEGSVAVDAGINDFGTATDILGKEVNGTRDIGVFELNGIDTREPVLITLNTADVVYTGEEVMLDFTVLDDQDNDITESVSLMVKYNGKDEMPLNAGNYNIVATVDEAMYSGQLETTFVIEKAEGEITISDDDLSVEYNGNTQEVNVVTDFQYSILYVDELNNESSEAPMNAGDYDVTVEIVDENYQGDFSSTYTITQRAVTIEEVSSTPSYTGEAIAFQYVVKDGDDNDISDQVNTVTTYDMSETVPSDAGTYAVVVTVVDDNNFSENTLSTNFTITPATVTFAVGETTFTYNGEEQIPTVTPSIEVALNQTVTGDASESINAGSYTLTTTINDDNYTGSDVSNFVINKATAKIEISDLTFIHDGNAKAVTVIIKDNEGQDLDVNYDITYKQNDEEILPIEVGEYDVTVMITDDNYEGTETATLEITEKMIAYITATTSTTYNGEAQPIVYEIKDAEGTLISVDQVDITYDSETDVPTNADTYDVNISITDDMYAGNADFSYTIHKAEVQFTVGAETFTYTGELQTPEVTTNVNGIAAITELTAGNGIDAGSHTLSLSVDDQNYEGSDEVTYSIGKAAVDISVSGLNHTYDMTEKEATVTTDMDNLEMTVTYNDSEELPMNAGSYEVVATIVDDNYEGSTTVSLVISKAIATITLSDLVHDFDGTSKSATATSDVEGLEVTVTYDGETEAPMEAGEYEVVANIEDANYEGTATETLVINAVTEEEPPLSAADDLFGVSVYPNPNTGQFTIDVGTSNPTSISIYTVSGVEVYSTELVNSKVITLPSNAKGVLIVKMISGDKSSIEKIYVK
ncbi:MBG domain-containing protein [Flammeovirga agarivorans]|uniref:T9SS type A sorting domain-containing protein n=1 Tax=Flammeovirga agarivorans TaxID=2726742 RepID=A0A7X8SP94_9BACT|nr:MBG domain-containing protein [Flammeovirga agarivorans]NLR93866.1 T9SS type A sorting domain-containing protein [Flammeovirga agarivorans]